MNGSSIATWYDGFADQQLRSGVNIRHRTICRNAIKAGLRSDHSVLEIGCGIGGLTTLLAKAVRGGSVLAVDISPRSVAIAQKRLEKSGHVRFAVTDMRGFTTSEQYDMVVLPDVIEHIPIEQHDELFGTVAAHLAPTGRVLINVPCPQVIEQLRLSNPAALQVIDQPIHADALITRAYRSGLVLESFTTYGLQYDHAEYHSIVLRHAYELKSLVRRSKWALWLSEAWSRLGW